MTQRNTLPPIEIDCADGEERLTLEVDNLDLGAGRARLRLTIELPGYGEGPDVTEGSDLTAHLDERKARELFAWLGAWLHMDGPTL